MTDAPVSKNTATNAALSTNTPEKYEALNGQEAHAAQVAQANQTTQASLEKYDAALSGNEQTANQIVTSIRDTQLQTNKQVADGSFDLNDNRGGAAALNNTVTASGRELGAQNYTNMPINNVGNVANAAKIEVVKPAAGHTNVVAVHPGDTLTTTFDPNTADLSMHGKDLEMKFADGSKIVLQGFATDLQHLPNVALANGLVVAGGVIIAQLQGTNENIFNLETAAGPAGGGEGGGQFSYSDDLGNVIGLLNKLPPIPFTALEFTQPQPNVTISDTETVGGTFTHVFETVDGQGNLVAGGFEDWQAAQNVGDYTQTPMALNITFTPDDNEVVDTIVISNIPNGVLFFYGQTNAYVPVVITNGSVTFTAAQLAAGNIFVLPTANNDADIPMTITLNIHDPDTNQLGVLSQTAVAVIDAVADLPSVSTSLTVNGVTMISPATGAEESMIGINANVTFPDNDGSEVHTIVLSGVPHDWTLVSSPGLTFTSVTEANGTDTYTVTVTANVNSTITFDPHEWTDAAGANLLLTVTTAESVTDGELTLANNTAEVQVPFTVTLIEDVPQLVRAESDSMFEHNLSAETATGVITANFFSDGPGAITLTTNNLSALGLTSHGETISYAVTTNNQTHVQTLTATDSGGAVVFTLVLNAPTAAGTEQTAAYTFTLFQELDHAAGAGNNNIVIPFQFFAADTDGDTLTSSFNITIIDDVPVAHSDIGNIPDGSSVATGNVITNDTLSVDVVNVLQSASFGGVIKAFATPDGTDAGGKFVLLNGAYGQLKIYENGAYTYTYDNAHNTGNHTETFNYSLIDFDSDTSATTLIINITDNGPGQPPSIVRTIDETTDINSVFNGTITVANATIFTLGDHGATAFTSGGSQLGGALTSHGVPVTVSLVGGQYVGMAGAVQVFTMSINNSGQYSFVLKAPIDQADGSNPNDVINLNFHYTASDADGDSVVGTIQVNVRDDAPVAFADTNTVADNTTTATGNVITNDTLSKDVGNFLKDVSFGGVTKSFATPDGSDVGGRFVLVNGTYGQIKIYENGAYTYTYDAAHNVGNHTEVFNYTLIDFDGDISVAPLTINIVDNGPGRAPDISRTIDETTDINSVFSGTITVANATIFSMGTPSGASDFSSTGSQLGGALTSHGVPVTVSLVGGQYVGMAGAIQVFTMSITAGGQYSFVLKAPLDQAIASDPNDTINLNFTYTAQDNDGDAVSGHIQVVVRDDAPVAIANVANIPDGGSVATGNVMTNDVLSKDVTNFLKDVSFGGVTKSFATPDGIDAGGKYVLVNGAYGQVKIYETGEFTYTYDNAHNTGNHTEVFNYTLVDYDRDTSATTLTINIVDKGPGQAPDVTRTIDETTDINLTVSNTIAVTGATMFALGTPAGASEFTSTGSLLGGNLTSNGVPITVSLVGGQYVGMAGAVQVFTLSINNSGQYSFVLKAPIDHANGADPNDMINLNFTYTAKDADGDSTSGHIQIVVKDDAPLAASDINSVADNTTTAVGNVMTNDTMSKDVVNLLKDVSFGAVTKSFATPDGTDGGGRFVLVNGAYGQIKIYENGNYTYTYDAAHNSGNHSEVFNYTLKDRDGDTSTTTLTINIVDNGPGVAPDISRTIDETTDINSVFSGTITVANATVFALGTPAGASDFSSTGSQLGGNLTSHGVPVTVSLVGGQYVGMAGAVQVFTMSITAGGQYSFVLKAPIDQADGTNPNDTINLNFTYTAKDADGDAVSGHIQVVVRDDAPVTVADIGNIPDGGSVATGNVMNNDVLSKDVTNLLQSASFGGVTKSFATPDGTDGGGRFVLVNGAYGQLKIYENGNYTYTYDNAHNSGNHSEVFNYTLVDYDRDTSATTLTINIVDKGPGTAPDISRTIDETTDINSIFSGTITVANATAFALGTPAGASGFTSTGSMLGGALTSHGVPVTVTLVGGQYVGKAGTLEVFTLSITAGGQYSFVLKAPIDQADGSNPNDVINLNFNYTARDADGDAVSGHIQVAVRDDAPVAVADVGTIPNGSSVATGNVITNDVLSKDVTNVLKDASFGGVTKSFATPDGTDAGGRFVLVNGAYGQLKIYENGNYTYTYDNAHNTGNHSEVFNYTLKDFDGDTSTTTLTLSITDGCPVAVNVTNTLDETTDINASISSTISVATATAFALGTVTGTSSFGSTGSLLGGNLTSHGVPITVTLVGGQYVGKAGAVEVFTLSINNSGQYNFVLKAPIDHASGTDPNDMINLNFAYTARDSDGDASEGQIRIIVKDDAPIAHADVNIFADTTVTNGNVITGLNGGTGAADTLSKDIANVMKDVSFGGVTKSFATPTGTDAGGAYVSINGAHGTLKIYADGNYTYTLSGGTPLPGNGGSTGDTFNYTIKDYDGDSSSTTLTLQTMLPKLIVGENVDDNTGQTTPYHVGTGTGVITGDTASDLLVGDVGGSALQNVDKDYNVVLILDTSSSMSGNKIALLKQAVVNLLGDLHNYAGGDVKVHIVPFNNSTEPVATFMVTANGDYNSAINFVNALTIDSHTNYEAPLQSAISWLQGNTSNDPIPGAQTFTYFVSDGAPNYYMNGNTPTSGSASLVMDQITGSDGTNEVAILQGFGEVIGVGIGVDSTTLGRLSVIDSGTDSAIDVQDPNDLSAALQAANPLNQLSGVGHDVLTGGDGNDLIFGDALNTDALAQAQHLTTSPGAGWMVFAELEANHGWSRADTINYIRSHVEELGHETLNSQGQSRTGGNDTIMGGNGNDIIFGQEGNDAINGGAGNDILSGGTGNNTLTGGAGADTFLFLHNGAAGHDTITDYNLAQGDKLDISDLLVGSGYTPGISSVDNFVKIDHVTGQVFVDSTGAGHFDNTNVVATLNGISGIDTLNVVLSDSEGTRTVHTV